MRKRYIKNSAGLRKPGTIAILFVLLPAVLWAQPEAYNWYFGNKAGISFASGTPVALSNGQMNQPEGCATISDKNGRLLFYTDGISVWNRNHQVMRNGENLAGGSSSTQSVFIVQQTGHDDIYYIFTVGQQGIDGRFSYSVVDMKKNKCLGDVIKKNELLYASTCEKLTAVRHCNRKDIWIITHHWTTNQYYAYLLTANGINRNPVISQQGVVTSHSTTSNYIGYMKASPDGIKLAVAHGGQQSIIELMDFDNSTGIISNCRQLSAVNITNCAYGVEFSPNSKLLYTTSARNSATGPEEVIYQYNTSLPTTTAIINSQQVIITDNSTAMNLQAGNGGFFGTLQTGPDKKIYFSRVGRPFLSIINDPDMEGPACNFIQQGVNLAAGSVTTFGLPNFIMPLFKKHILTTSNCQSLSIGFSIDNTDGVNAVKWDFDDPASGSANTSSLLSPVHNFSAGGIYAIRLVLFKADGCADDTITQVINIGPLQVQLGNDTTICQSDTLMLSPGIIGATYEWSDGTCGPTLNVTQEGTYWVNVTLAGCTASDTIMVSFQSTPFVNLGNDTTLCEDQTLVLNAGNTGAQYVWQDNSSEQMYLVDTPGNYIAAVTKNGCTSYDTITVQYTLKPRFSIGPDTVICDEQTIVLQPDIPDQPGLTYAWQNGNIENTFTVQQPGAYSLSVSNECGNHSDTVTVTKGVCKLFIPTAFSPNADGRNDVFRPMFGEHVERFDMKIYNRWGQLVFHSNNLRQGWDGTFNGHLQPSGSYAWFITYTTTANSSAQYLNGMMTLAR